MGAQMIKIKAFSFPRKIWGWGDTNLTSTYTTFAHGLSQTFVVQNIVSLHVQKYKILLNQNIIMNIDKSVYFGCVNVM